MSRCVVIRTAAGHRAGFGHLRRCLSLAEALRAERLACRFRLTAPSEATDIVRDVGFQCDLASAFDEADARLTSEAADEGLVVVDAYSAGSGYLQQLRRHAALLVLIDDLVHEAGPADIIVNPALGAERAAYERGAGTEYLLGAQYALLRPGFDAPPPLKSDTGRVLVTSGGSDPHDLTPRLARAALAAGASAVDAIVGPFAEPRPVAGVAIHRQPAEPRALMTGADLALCAGGQTLYELAATATPAVAVRIADNQTFNLAAFEEAGAIRRAGDVSDEDLEPRLTSLTRALLADRAARERMGCAGRAAVDGGGARRVAQALVRRLQEARA